MFHRAVIVLSFSLVLAMVVLHAAVARLSPAGPVRWEPAKLVPGSPVLFEIPASTNVQEVTAKWFGHEVSFFRPADASDWYALAAVPLETHAGIHELTLRETLVGGESVEIRRNIRIARAVYPKITAKVAKQFTEPNPEQLKEISADKEVK